MLEFAHETVQLFSFIGESNKRHKQCSHILDSSRWIEKQWRKSAELLDWKQRSHQVAKKIWLDTQKYFKPASQTVFHNLILATMTQVLRKVGEEYLLGGSALRSNPLPFYIPFWQKRYPFYIPFIEKSTPFTYLL